MLVIPEPVSDNALHINGHDIFYIKFGDGHIRDAYDVHNPVYAGSETNHCGTTKTTVTDLHAKELQVWSGKAYADVL